MEKKDLILKLNEIKGKIGFKINPSIIKDLAAIYGLWIREKDNKAIIGRDTRPSGELIENAIIEGLHSVGCKVNNLGICPTPVIFYLKNKYNIKGGILISASNRPINWNKIKLYIDDDFSFIFELKGEYRNQNREYSKHYNYIQKNQILQNINPISTYVNDLLENFNIVEIRRQNKLRVIVDPGAGASKLFTPNILERLGCEVLVINKELDKNNEFPRELNPIKENLKDLMLALWKGNLDIGFAHDCDANKVTIISDDFECYSEDIISALIIENYIKHKENSDKSVIFLLNLASSLRFENLAERYNIQVLKSYVENKYLKKKINKLLTEEKYFIFGTDRLCGGPVFTNFSKVSDGFFISAKLIEILVDSGTKLSNLISKLPKYYSYHEKIPILKQKLDIIIKKLYDELSKEGETVNKVGNNLRFGHEKDWFVLVFPSQDSAIKVYSEARRDSLARLYCETTTELLKLVVSNV
ncbi:MAG: hypothetical protein ACFFHV_08210 [Promethearchaeota archaeon]